MTSNEGFSRDQLNDVGGGDYTVTVGPNGDVFSVNTEGGFETRPKGSAGSWERCRVTESGTGVVFRPFGQRTFFFLLTDKWKA